MAAPGADRRYPDPEALLGLLRKALTLRYLAETAEWVQRQYPGSADQLLPEIRKLYAEKKRAGIRW